MTTPPPGQQDPTVPFGSPQQPFEPQQGYPGGYYPQAPPGYGPIHGYAQQPMQPQSNGIGTAGGVLGILALVFSIIPIIGLIAWILAPLGLVLGAIGTTRSPKGLAVTGVVTSAIALIICFSWAASFADAFG